MDVKLEIDIPKGEHDTMESKLILRDLNPGPTGYEPVALTNWAKDQ